MSESVFGKVLVANRGEIARRVFRTCRERNIATVAVYSAADRGALHVLDADEAISLDGETAAESYLDIEKILGAARKSGAGAIHPGYGFLSERPDFAEACERAGIAFVGPQASAMRVMGDKVAARAAMIEAGVPVVPGRSDIPDAEQAEAAAEAIGFPVMIKASAGGGGKGMRVVGDRASVRAAFEAAVRESTAAFGDGRVFLERAISDARHVEIQLMADAHGTIVHLGERDCSVQRRHQKVIEESPCPSAMMTPQVRAAMGEVAIRAAAAVHYRGAGTVEFLFEETPSGPKFYFLEMNTRLQVEHAVTEAVTGRDLVWDQLRVAAGAPLGYTARDVELRGHAIECRIYAEDPWTFLPSPGWIELVRWPEGGHVRVDAAVATGSEVSGYYDPMIAKVTTWGSDRRAAIMAMRRALREMVIVGVQTNIALHQRVLVDPAFVEGNAVNTRYLEHHADLTRPPTPPVSDAQAEALAVAAAVHAAGRTQAIAGDANNPTVVSPWWRAVRWRR